MNAHIIGLIGFTLLLSLPIIWIWMAWRDPAEDQPTKEPRPVSHIIMVPLMLAANLDITEVTKNSLVIDGKHYRFDRFTSIDGDDNGKIVLALMLEES